jgi:hypothetical protein
LSFWGPLVKAPFVAYAQIARRFKSEVQQCSIDRMAE